MEPKANKNNANQPKKDVCLILKKATKLIIKTQNGGLMVFLDVTAFQKFEFNLRKKSNIE